MKKGIIISALVLGFLSMGSHGKVVLADSFYDDVISCEVTLSYNGQEISSSDDGDTLREARHDAVEEACERACRDEDRCEFDCEKNAKIKSESCINRLTGEKVQ